MSQTASWIYVAIELLLVGLAVLAPLTLGHLSLAGARAIAHDGIRPGTRAPAWTLVDTDGQSHESPPGAGRWILLLFADHSLKYFPDAVQRLSDLADLTNDETPRLLIVSRARMDVTGILRLLGLDCPVISVPQLFYGRHNVRVVPYGLLIDPQGMVRDSRLVNSAWEALTIWNIARILSQREPIDPNKIANIGHGRPEEALS
jgi:hypothetical protein